MPDRNASPEPTPVAGSDEPHPKFPPPGPPVLVSDIGIGIERKRREAREAWEQTRVGPRRSGAQTAPRRRWYRWAQELMMPDRKTPPESTDPPAGPKKMSIDGLELPPPGPAEIISESGFGTKLVRPTEDGQGDQVVRV